VSGLIFVALAVAWAAYLIPKALRHHDDVARGRSIDRFSHSLRVLARREPVSAREARLVATGDAARRRPDVLTAEEQDVVHRASTRKATRRRRRVLALLVLALAGVVAAVATGRLGAPYAAAPAGLLVVWLVTCRLMVRAERAWHPVLAETPAQTTVPGSAAGAGIPTGTATSTSTGGDDDPTGETPRVDPNLWDPVPVTLPTYVSKPPARRSVRTIDLDATGVWTSGRTESDTALAREADAAQAAERALRRTSDKNRSGDEAVGS
jgi:hypothetical protein